MQKSDNRSCYRGAGGTFARDSPRIRNEVAADDSGIAGKYERLMPIGAMSDEDHSCSMANTPYGTIVKRRGVARVFAPNPPNPASIALPVATPVRRIPFRLPKPSQCGPYSLGLFNAVFQALLTIPAAKLFGPTVEFTNHAARSLCEIG